MLKVVLGGVRSILLFETLVQYSEIFCTVTGVLPRTGWLILMGSSRYRIQPTSSSHGCTPSLPDSPLARPVIPVHGNVGFSLLTGLFPI